MNITIVSFGFYVVCLRILFTALLFIALSPLPLLLALSVSLIFLLGVHNTVVDMLLGGHLGIDQ